jgi:phage shock protein C
MDKRLYRSKGDRMIWGVCGGLAKYFAIDPTIVRLITVLLIFAGGIGVIAYIILAIVVPVEGSQSNEPGQVIRDNVEEIKDSATSLGKEIQSAVSKESKNEEPDRTREHRLTLLGAILIIIGAAFLIGNFVDWFRWSVIWPVVIVLLGVLVILLSTRKSK